MDAFVKGDVLLVGGFSSTLNDFDLLVAEMKKWCNPIVILLPEGNFSSVVDSIRDFIDGMRLPPLPIIGYSMGGRVVLELLRTYPEIFTNVICLSSRLHVPKGRAEFETLIETKLRSLELNSFFDWWYSLPIFTNFRPNQILLQEKVALGKKILLSQCSHLKITKQKGLKPPFALPLHLIYGEKDPLLNEVKTCFKDSLEAIFVHNIPDSGHLIHLEQPTILSEHIKKVLR